MFKLCKLYSASIFTYPPVGVSNGRWLAGDGLHNVEWEIGWEPEETSACTIGPWSDVPVSRKIIDQPRGKPGCGKP